MKLKYGVISADSHINEPPDLWTARLPASLKERGPHVIETRSGADAWVVEDTERPMPLGLNSVHYWWQKGKYDRSNYREKFEEIRVKGVKYDDILTGSFDPKARVTELDEDKVDAEILYNGAGIWPAIKNIRDDRLNLACFKSYNDWLSEYQSYDPERLVGGGIIPVTGIDDALEELRRCVEELHFKTVTLESYPSGRYDRPTAEDDRFWSEITDLGIPVNVHVTFSFPTGGLLRSAFRNGGTGESDDQERTSASAVDGSYQRVFADMVLSGVFDRYPTLKFVGAETGASWLLPFQQQFDDYFLRYHAKEGVSLQLMPSEYLRRNGGVTYVVFDQVGLRNRYSIGLEMLMWSSDFPHSGSVWPIDGEVGYESCQLAGCTPTETERIMWRTAAETYGLDVDTTDLTPFQAVSPVA
jgi:uncharacterized protein